MTTKVRRLQLQVEALECRAVPDGSGFRLDLVAAHEIGHALGLEHCGKAGSIMREDYNGSYDLSMLASDPAVVVDETDGYTSLLELYSLQAIADNTTPWKDNLDPNPNNLVVNPTWSIMPDGAKIRNVDNIIHAAFDAKIGPGWEQQLSDALSAWEAASQGRIGFIGWGDIGREFDYAGDSQNDLDSGDIRFGAYPMDGEGGKLAQSYFPPPGGATAPGDIHFDASEPWTPGGGMGSGGGGGDGGVLNPRPGGVGGGGSSSDDDPTPPPPVTDPGTPNTGADSPAPTPPAPTTTRGIAASTTSSMNVDILIPLSPASPGRPGRR